ncbi:MAG TPA: prepilin-type N-terminal cleavage/methylation domain-containing protein [Pirellulaceae bacterium]|nr:prepilin-type N-terminal cleavage/methylation domain-containing protein [Pirellulaceae bacterium]
MSQSLRRRPGGFTLVELLVVIIIIGILAALLIPVINGARRNANQARISIEITQLESALEAYKNDHGGDFPADLTDAVAFKQHMARAYPRHNRAAIDKWLASNPATQKPANLDPAEAIVLWLGLVRNDVLFPFTDSSGNNVPLAVGSSGQGKPYFTFTPAQLTDRDGDGWPEFYPQAIAGQPGALPYVYFHNKTYATACYPFPAPGALGTAPVGADPGPPPGVARPYRTAALAFVEPTKYQIISCGLDLHYGKDTVVNLPNQPKLVPTKVNTNGVNLDRGDQDNLTSFAKGQTIEGLRQ